MKKQVRNIALAGSAAAIVTFGFVLPKTNAQDNDVMVRSYVEETTDENGNTEERVNVMKLENKDKKQAEDKDKTSSTKEASKATSDNSEKNTDKKQAASKTTESKTTVKNEKKVRSKKVSVKDEELEPIMFSRAMHFKDYDKKIALEEIEEPEAEEAVEEVEEVDKEVAEAEASATTEEVTVKK